MSKTSLEEAQKDLEGVMLRAKSEDITLFEDGEAIAVLMSMDRYKTLMGAEKQAEEITTEAEGNVPW